MAEQDVDMTDALTGNKFDVAGDPARNGLNMAEATAMNDLDLPDDCPEIPEFVPTDDLIAIVSLHHPRAFWANCDSPCLSVPIIHEKASPEQSDETGCTLFLQQKVGQPTYAFGKRMGQLGARQTDGVDVFLPMTAAAKKQFTLVPAHETDFEEHRTDEAVRSWRVESASETITTVNGVPIQKYTFRTKKKKVNNPHGLYLDDSRKNQLDVLGMKIDIWFVKKAGFVLDSEPTFAVGPLSQALQYVNPIDHGNWARDRYILGRLAEPISNRSYRVLQRFTGRIETAKLFRGPDGLQDRNREFLMFYDKIVHESLVDYNERVILDGIPAIITDSYQGMIEYGTLQAQLKEEHPTIRFMVAAAILRPLFSALEYLHHNRIIHNSVDVHSVLINFKNNRVRKVLLVDYSTTYAIPPEEEMPREAMLNDSRRAMELIEDLCNIWALRSVPAPHAVHEDEMRRRTEVAEEEFVAQDNACRYFFENKGDDRHSVYGRRMLKVLAQKEMDWSRAKANQLHNAGQLQIGSVAADRLQNIVRYWEIPKPKDFRGDGPSRSIEDEEHRDLPMMLTLGHKFLDDLANPLYHTRWDLLPRDICAKLRSLEGEVQNPWRTFGVTREVWCRIRTKEDYNASKGGLRIVGLLDYMTTYCDMFPDWRDKIMSIFAKFVAQKGPRGEPLAFLLGAFEAERVCSPDMRFMLQTLEEAQALFDSGQTLEKLGTQSAILANGNGVNVKFAEEHHICYHVPSGMFNVTQLQRLQCTTVLEKCLANSDIRCDNFVEVRGESSIQGHYIALSLLPKFAKALELTVNEEPECERLHTGNPSDFSNVSPGRVVLAHSGLVAFASVSRTGGQFSHLPTSPKDVESADPFLPTYFGNIKVLPRFSDGKPELPRAGHWVRFKRAEDIEEDMSRAESQATGRRLLSRLPRALRRRETVIAGALDPPRPSSEATSRLQPLPKIGRENLGLTMSFIERNPNLLRSPPYRGLDFDQPFKPIDLQKTTAQERREFREKSKFWTDAYLPSNSGDSSEDDDDDTVNGNDQMVAVLGNPTEQASTVADDGFPPLTQGPNYGARWLAARAGHVVGDSAAASAGMETELADTIMMDWDSQVESTCDMTEDAE